MASAAQNSSGTDLDEAKLANDERWLLVNRVLASEGFQRAGQLRKILLHVSRSAILEPDRVFHEYEIACDVLERRQDFDPANDNIVRAQASHLRRKLEKYFSEDNPSEPVLIVIPRGSYIPQFVPNPHPQPGAVEEPEAQELPVALQPPGGATAVVAALPQSPWWRTWTGVGFILCAIACVVLGTALALTHKAAGITAKEGPQFSNGFIPLLAKGEGNVSIVLPDTSLSMIQLITGADIAAADYNSKDYPERQIGTVQDPQVRAVLNQLAQKRNTTVSEARIGFDFADALNRTGGHAVVRYARDIHVRDFNESSIILIGAQASNPWVSLFRDRTNFRYVLNPVDNHYFFQNTKPLPGEDPSYAVSMEVTKDRVNYVDVAFLSNPLQNGYTLLVVGSDLAANEAAGNLILHGKLPPKVSALLARKEPRSFELFLRGRHITGESEDALEVLSVRDDTDMPAQTAKTSP
jgi:hypothetical protein